MIGGSGAVLAQPCHRTSCLWGSPMQRPYQVRFLDAVSPLSNGTVLEGDFKIWIYDDGACYWEFRRMLFYVIKPGAKVCVHRQLKESRALWTAEFEYFGVPAGALTDSFNAARCSGDDAALEDPHTRDEYTISTAAALVLMLFWYRTARVKDKRDRCQGLLTGFLQRVGGQIGQWVDTLADALRREAHLCDSDVEHGMLCVHMQAESNQGHFEISSWTEFVDVLSHLRCGSDVCHSSKAALGAFIAQLARFIDSRAAKLHPELGLKDDLKRRRLLSVSAGKRMRVDEDYKHQTAVARLVLRDGPNAGRLIKGDDVGCSSSNGRHWEAKVCLAHQAACLAAFADSRVVHLCEDGSRLGDPAEETIVYVVWAACEDLAGFPPPQVVLVTTLETSEPSSRKIWLLL